MVQVINKKKYQNVVLYLCQKLGGEIRGKKKLAKLLYFVDFDFYEKYQKAITGDTYKALPMGPFPTELEKITSDMAKKKLLVVDAVPEREGYLSTEVYKNISKPDLAIFTKEEIKMLDRIATKYGHLNGKQLEELSHAEAPFIATEPKKEIFYELSFYRGTDFTEV
ncbi:MAG: hypothetical protein A2909_03265 [Candidatus Tagabacteria bacterium RIFCSPLOWO2_01_FULL_39_11]|uniref:Antitoxin SocA-like Panacea domain-containing protein n=1 Tax=Candidatus Tagabacteria bacterium RIFCSPLOWO2_01_FULL_39_11 TaxID=1802295 RepID=A0A1G2LSR4_9BACT|nr:MAG: hypothetical protein A2909_03265 [Candidatus Tagabacteria bacterium RIFCSPLOWO2_01_FULL_39_11]